MDYYEKQNSFPQDSDELNAFLGGTGLGFDPYHPKRAPIGYRHVLDGTQESCELYTYRLEAPVWICSASGSEVEWKTSREFDEILSPQLSAEGRNLALRPNPSLGDRVLYYAARIKEILFAPLFWLVDKTQEDSTDNEL